MRLLILPLLLLLATLADARAQAFEQGQLCRAAIRAAEAEAGIPAHLLMAIARMESGRADPVTGNFHPWPWTINAEGRGSFYPDRAAAIAAVRQMQAQGIRSIDTGCMQVNQRHHPNAFASLEEAFDPVANARYAARFLGQLRAELGDWNRATAAYHSRNPDISGPYQARVAQFWAAESRNPAAPAALPPGAMGALASVAAPRPLAPGPASGGGGQMLSNGAERVQVLAAAPGTQGRGLDAYRGMPIPLAARAPMGGLMLVRRM